MDDFERRLASRLSAYEQSVSVPDPLSVNPAPHRRAWAAVAMVVVLAVGIGLVGSRLLSGVRPVGNGPVPSRLLSGTIYREFHALAARAQW